jgi:hypothetical protein
VDGQDQRNSTKTREQLESNQERGGREEEESESSLAKTALSMKCGRRVEEEKTGRDGGGGKETRFRDGPKAGPEEKVKPKWTMDLVFSHGQ